MVTSCDLLKNIYLCGINNNSLLILIIPFFVVICLKISTFVVLTTTILRRLLTLCRCDLLKNIYLCGINNNSVSIYSFASSVVICLKISTFVVLTTTPAADLHNEGGVVICLKISTFVVLTTTSVVNLPHFNKL